MPREGDPSTLPDPQESLPAPGHELLLKGSWHIQTHLGLGRRGCPMGRYKVGAGALLRTDEPVRTEVGLQVLSPKNCPLKVKDYSVPTCHT